MLWGTGRLKDWGDCGSGELRDYLGAGTERLRNWGTDGLGGWRALLCAITGYVGKFKSASNKKKLLLAFLETLPSKSPASSLWPLWSSDTALRGSPFSLRRPNSLDASNDLWPGMYLARDRQNLQRPLFPFPECCYKMHQKRVLLSSCEKGSYKAFAFIMLLLFFLLTFHNSS